MHDTTTMKVLSISRYVDDWKYRFRMASWEGRGGWEEYVWHAASIISVYSLSTSSESYSSNSSSEDSELDSSSPNTKSTMVSSSSSSLSDSSSLDASSSEFAGLGWGVVRHRIDSFWSAKLKYFTRQLTSERVNNQQSTKEGYNNERTLVVVCDASSAKHFCPLLTDLELCTTLPA